MRIIAGEFKGLIIKAPKDIRPTEDKVRKSLFDILGSSIQEASFLDLFSGSGSVGLEALSRGAAKAVFVDKGSRYMDMLQELTVRTKNRALQESVNRIELLNNDVFRVIKDFAAINIKFDIIFLDPPYYLDMAKKTLQSLGQYDILTQFGSVIAQIYKKDQVVEETNFLRLYRTVRYGDTALLFYNRVS